MGMIQLIKRMREIRLKRCVKQCGENPSVFGKIYISEGKTISIGDNFRINEGCKVFGRMGSTIEIGNDVTLSPGVTVLASGYDINQWIDTGKKVHLKQKTIIGNHIWLCSGSIVTGGCQITGEYVTLAAGAVLVDDIKESYCLYSGVPAKMVKKYR